MRFARHMVAGALIFASQQLMAISPLGEDVAYKLDRSRDRTSSIIRSGKINLKVVDQSTAEDGREVYGVAYNYDFTVAFLGRQQGADVTKVATEYFEPAFMERVRQEKDVTTDSFKIRYLGHKDVTLGELAYLECDEVLLYDLDLKKLNQMPALMRAILAKIGPQAPNTGARSDADGQEDAAPPAIEQVEIRAALKQGEVPVMGAVQVDVSGVRQGMRIKMGFDYTPNTQSES